MADLTPGRLPKPRFPERDAQLGQMLAWLGAVSHGSLTEDLATDLVRHRREVDTDPAILVAAAVLWLSLGADRQPGSVKQLWNMVDRVSAQLRGRYTGTPEDELL
jgi:hypothetical protein